MPDTDIQQDDILNQKMANAIRALSMDAVQKANSGHPGMPMGMADVATVLFSKFMRFDPKWPTWPNRDRFVLSAGHGSMLIYSLLHLTGYERPTMEDIKNFRQLHSPTAGHPEFGECPGVETTTGPLGQGLATSVGMAIAERLSNEEYGDDITDHFTYVLAGDGCLMEGVSQEAISLAGHLKLSKMIVLWDDNSISIDGSTDLSTSEDQAMRFEAAGWHVQAVDGHDMESIEAAIAEAQRADQPSLIACRTTIGYGAPNKQGTAATHGAPLGDDEIKAAREFLGWDHAPFEIPEDVLAAWRAVGEAGASLSADWKAKFETLDGFVKEDFERRLNKDLPKGFAAAINDYKAKLAAEPVKVATRKASQMALEVVNGVVPETIGGSADLTGSNLTKTSQTDGITADDFSGRYMYYGIREFEMCAAMNGIALYNQHIPYGGTFMVFTDYARPAIRLAALMKQRSIYVMTHDSIGLGEDGPTHQPVEHLPALRAMPNLNVFRPCDAVETAECWALALEAKETPSVLSLTRQSTIQQRLEHTDENLCAKGGYVLHEASTGAPKVVLIASGSEVELAAAARETLEADGVPTRVVSMPSTELFDAQDAAYKASVLPEGTVRGSIEAASTYGWAKYTGLDGVNIGIDSFGASAPAEDLYKHFGITSDALVAAVREKL
ncbi:transketolase [Kordiimonas lacus]|uniref:Transketolase n=1 Tax=Kordiimonas lacus TaxID=637679 RepID=A0A1G6ZY46_9PROT|nr:transketolase [Kordiimonas lacus]SDE07588.1 transketolase [Kordiimonas lacus]